MKILLLNYEFPPLGGGAGNATANLARELTLLGHRVSILTSAFSNLPREETYQGYKIYRVWSCRHQKYQGNILEMLFYIFFAILFIPKLFAKEGKPDKVISFFSLPSGLVAYWLKKKYGLPYILSLRGGDVPGFYSRALKFYHFFTLPLNKKIWRSADYLVANSQSLSKLANKTASSFGQTVKVIPNGVNINLFSPLFPQKPAKFKIIFAGRLCPQKGVAELITAIHELNNHGISDLECVIAGHGPLFTPLKKMVTAFKLEQLITFTGWLDREKLLTEYQAADVFILPSTDEGMSNVILEAMATGLVVIAKDIIANRELITHGINGLLYNTASELPMLITQLMSDSNLKAKLAHAARARAAEFSWQHVAALYQQLLIS